MPTRNCPNSKKSCSSSHLFIFVGSYLYSLQIRPKPGVKLIKWNLYDFIPEENEFNGHRGYFAMITHGLEAPPLELHMVFDVICFFVFFVFFWGKIYSEK